MNPFIQSTLTPKATVMALSVNHDKATDEATPMKEKKNPTKKNT